jgi:DNA-binding response OmpR family regulator
LENGSQGILEFEIRNPDLVFLDLMLPGIDGAEILKKIRAINTGVPVIIITGYPDGECMNRVLEQGPITVLKKPLSVDALKAVVASAVKGYG